MGCRLRGSPAGGLGLSPTDTQPFPGSQPFPAPFPGEGRAACLCWAFSPWGCGRVSSAGVAGSRAGESRSPPSSAPAALCNPEAAAVPQRLLFEPEITSVVSPKVFSLSFKPPEWCPPKSSLSLKPPEAALGKTSSLFWPFFHLFWVDISPLSCAPPCPSREQFCGSAK